MLQVQLQLVSAAVKLFLKKPTGKPQAMIQLVLTYATQVGALRLPWWRLALLRIVLVYHWARRCQCGAVLPACQSAQHSSSPTCRWRGSVKS